MSIAVQFPSSRSHRLRAQARRAPRALWLVLAVALSWGAEVAVYTGFAPHGEALRHELQGAAGVLQAQLVPQPSPAVLQAMRRHFHESDVDIDMARLAPNVAVTLRGVLREDCLDALRQARHINGPVVIALEGYGSAVDCRDHNDMTWWLMP